VLKLGRTRQGRDHKSKAAQQPLPLTIDEIEYRITPDAEVLLQKSDRQGNT
jgi:hypothetical protein